MKQVGIAGDPNLAVVQLVAEALGELCESVVFVGGCAAGLLVTRPRAQMIRATRDVDVVAEVVTIQEYRRFERSLRARGFNNDQSADAPICRWTFGEVILDAMPTAREVLGFGNSWYSLAIQAAEPVRLAGGPVIRLVSAPVFLATKLEAFRGRGNNDFLASHDLEDVASVIDGRPELLAEARQQDARLRDCLRREFTALLQEPGFMTAVPGYLPGDMASQARLPALLEKIRLLAEGA